MKKVRVSPSVRGIAMICVVKKSESALSRLCQKVSTCLS